MSSSMVRKESSCFVSAVHTVHAFLHLCASTELWIIIALARDLVLLAIFNRRGVTFGGCAQWPIERKRHLSHTFPGTQLGHTIQGTAFGYTYHLKDIIIVLWLFLDAGQAIVVGAHSCATATKIYVNPILSNPHWALWMASIFILAANPACALWEQGLLR